MRGLYNLFRMEMNSGTILGYFLQAVPITILVGVVYIVWRLVFLKRERRRVPWFPELMRLLFVCYLTGLCSLVILPANFWLHVFDGVFFGWWENLGGFFRLGEVNLVPSLVRCLSGELILGSWVKEMLVGNVAMFLPFGFFLPLSTERLSGKRALVAAALVPVAVELLQLTVGRSFDVDDLICNFLGIAIGYGIGAAAKRTIFSGFYRPRAEGAGLDA